MHEFSLVRSLVAQVEQIVADQGGGAVKSIRLTCGTLSGVEPLLVSSAFELLRTKRNLGDVSLVIDEVPLQVRCRSCATDFEPQQFRFTCPQCGSADTAVIRGDTLVLESIELEPLAASD